MTQNILRLTDSCAGITSIHIARHFMFLPSRDAHCLERPENIAELNTGTEIFGKIILSVYK